MQQVNLYLAEYRPRREWLSLEYCAAGLMLFLFAMIAMNVFRYYELGSIKQHVTVLEQREAALKAEVKGIKQTASASNKNALQTEVEQIRAVVENRNAIKEIMSGNSMGNRTGFSSLMFTLGDKQVDDLVVDHFKFSQGGVYVALEGVAKRSESVPLYVHQLQKTLEFNAAKFGFLTITESAGLARFRLSGEGAMTIETLQPFSKSQFAQ